MEIATEFKFPGELTRAQPLFAAGGHAHPNGDVGDSSAAPACTSLAEMEEVHGGGTWGRARKRPLDRTPQLCGKQSKPVPVFFVVLVQDLTKSWHYMSVGKE